MLKAVPRAISVSSVLRKSVVLLLLLCHATSATAIVPFVVTALADLDGSHEVMVQCAGGGTGIRLHHRSGDFTPCRADHRSLAGRTAALLCRPSTEGDHCVTSSPTAWNTEIKHRQGTTGEKPAAEAVYLAVRSAADLHGTTPVLTRTAARDPARWSALAVRHRVKASVCLLI